MKSNMNIASAAHGAALIVLCAGLLCSGIAQLLDSLTLGPTADAWIQDEGGNSRDDNAGSANLMAVGGRWQTTFFRGLIRFDLTGIPAGSNVLRGQLNLYHTTNAVEGTNTNNVDAYVLQSDWVEAEVTWNDASSSTPWALPGADSIGADREDSLVARNAFVPTTPANQYYTFDVRPAVQDWVDGSKPNFGLMLTSMTPPAADRYFSGFATREAAANQPFLDVLYDTVTAVWSDARPDRLHGTARIWAHASGAGIAVRYSVPHVAYVVLGIYDTRGGLVRTLVDREVAAGMHVVHWQGYSRNQMLSRGMYICRLVVGGRSTAGVVAAVR